MSQGALAALVRKAIADLQEDKRCDCCNTWADALTAALAEATDEGGET